MSVQEPVRRRRPSGEVRSLLQEAARELFLTKGYEKTTTEEICLKAGVAKPLLFSNFGSKAGLFDAAVVGPISEFVAAYVTSWEQHSADMPRDERVEQFVTGLFDLAKRNRTVLLSAVVQRMTNGPRQQDDVLDHLARALQGVRGVTDLSEYHDLDPPAITAAAVGMVLGVALLDDLLFASKTQRPGRARLIAEMTKLLFYGTVSRPAAAEDA